MLGLEYIYLVYLFNSSKSRDSMTWFRKIRTRLGVRDTSGRSVCVCVCVYTGCDVTLTSSNFSP